MLKNLCILKGDGPSIAHNLSFTRIYWNKRNFFIALFHPKSFHLSTGDRESGKNIIKLDYINIALSMGSLCFLLSVMLDKNKDGTWLLMWAVSFVFFASRLSFKSFVVFMFFFGIVEKRKRERSESERKPESWKLDRKWQKDCLKSSRTYESRKITIKGHPIFKFPIRKKHTHISHFASRPERQKR